LDDFRNYALLLRIRDTAPLSLGDPLFRNLQLPSKKTKRMEDSKQRQPQFEIVRPAESKLAARRKEGSMPVRLRQGYGATVFASPQAASEDWSLGDPSEWCVCQVQQNRLPGCVLS